MASKQPPVRDSFDGKIFDYDEYYRNTVENSLTGTRSPQDPRRRWAIHRQIWNRLRGVIQYKRE